MRMFCRRGHAMTPDNCRKQGKYDACLTCYNMVREEMGIRKPQRAKVKVVAEHVRKPRPKKVRTNSGSGVTAPVMEIGRGLRSWGRDW